ncbi:hypothetical protein KK062_23155 [Fulvivirgaceae bacterium PWU5]|uniref:Uncharacterized protein n=1 Tax=Dawidia cretensis TaxID=2782350 RepID=A0AAP2GRY0_9BACT|nr:hypothetical protein [Dawidia cretensis]MBT1711161.1 hypothetical protein [Dawidia cretensis]
MWTVAVFTLSWRLVNEVHFANDKILIVGYTLNTRWEKEIDIKSSRIEIRSKNTGRSRDEYYLRIKSSNKSQDINGTYNWDYTSLLTIFHEFKRIKGEKITSGEEYDLDIMDKKSKGLSTSLFDFSFNWKRNNK